MKKFWLTTALLVALVVGAPFAAHPEEMSARLVIDHHKIPSYFIGEWCNGLNGQKSKTYNWELPSVTDCSDKNTIISVGDDSFDLNGVEYRVTGVKDIPEECAHTGCSSSIRTTTSQKSIFVMTRYKHNLYLEQIH